MELPIGQARHLFLKSGLYHALYRASEYIGGETWGDNLTAHTKSIQAISGQNRQREEFNILLLGSATSTSIEQVLRAIQRWQDDRLIKHGHLTVIDLNSAGYNKLKPEFKKQVDFIRMDIRNPALRFESFDFITSDYVLNFIPRDEIASTIRSMGNLLKRGGVFDATVDIRRRSLAGRVMGATFVRNGLTLNMLNGSIEQSDRYALLNVQRAESRKLAKASTLGADRIVWGFKKI